MRGEVRWETKLTCGQTSDILRHQDKCRRGSDMMADGWPLKLTCGRALINLHERENYVQERQRGDVRWY